MRCWVIAVSTGVVLLFTFIFDERHFYAQPLDDGVLSVKLAPEDAEDLGTLPLSYRVYGEPNFLRVALTLSNLSEAPIVVDQEVIRKAFRIRVEAAAEIPLVIQWLPDIRLPGQWTPFANSGTPLLIEPRTAVSWIIALERADGSAFARGDYLLEYETSNIQGAVRKFDNTPWVGRGPSRPARMGLLIAPPGNPRERSAMHRLAAREAMLREEFTEAAEAYSRALAADPTDREARGGLAGMLLILNRYSEAIPHYEQLLPTLSPESLMFSHLAQAYLGIGDEQNARRVLRTNGLMDDRIEVEVTRLRDAIRRRR